VVSLLPRWAAGLTVLLSGLAACSDTAMQGSSSGGSGAGTIGGDSGTSIADASTTEGGPAADPCADACVDMEADAGAATCHACRCKVAFDGWLPGPDELQCADAIPIVTYHADLSSGSAVLEPSPINASSCANPSLLTGSCRPGSRLGRLEHDDVVVQWICRDVALDVDGSALFHDVAVIGHNVRTGATCFWDDVDDVTHEDDLPRLDLAEATSAELERHLAVFDLVDPDVCTKCHDHDPFVYTPYLASTGWVSVAQGKGPYSTVSLDVLPAAVDASHLVSDAAAPCLACHRLGSNNTCGRFAGDAMGSNKEGYYEAEVREAAEPGSPHWLLAHWMPTESLAIADYDAWVATFGAAREHILGCCASPGIDSDECRWAPVPAE
jgi:hypothetical protein